MCGIAGIVGEGIDALDRMSSRIAHRGPDGAGIWIDREAQVGLAHRRLAIIDLSDEASQPMSAVNGRYKVVFNGEIYNFMSFERELLERGYVYNTRSDTAVLGPLYDAFGPKMLPMLNGIFAFAIWDSKERSLFLARDHVGAKPLYFCNGSDYFAFASELKSLLAIPSLDMAIDESAIFDYLTKLWSPGMGTPLKSVRKLPPGQCILLKSGHTVQASWLESAAATVPSYPGAEGYGRALDHLLRTVVSDQCISDVPVGAFLSGGIDSTSVVAAMVETGHRPAQTYCIGFHAPGERDHGFDDDIAYAKIAADTLGVPLKLLHMDHPAADDFERLALMIDEPQADPAPLYVSAISQAARSENIKVLLSGAGGDDIFSGYRRHTAAVLHSLFGPLRGIGSLIPDLNRNSALGRRISRFKAMIRGDESEFLNQAFSFNDPQLAGRCLSPAFLHGARQQPNDYWNRAVESGQDRTLVDRCIQLERHGFLPDHNLNYTDKASMAHGVEVRVPLLDPRLIAFADALPINYKVRGLTPKWLLKQRLGTKFPRSFINRPKTGFGGPVRSWINGPLAPALQDLLASAAFRSTGIFDHCAIDAVRRDTKAGLSDGSYLLLAVMMVHFWSVGVSSIRNGTLRDYPIA